MTLCELPSMATTSTPNFSTNDCPTAENIAQILWVDFLEYSSKRIWAGIPNGSSRNVDNHSIESILFNIFPTLCPCYYCQNRNSDDIGK